MSEPLRKGSPLAWDDGHRGVAEKMGNRVLAKVWHEEDPDRWWWAPLPIEEAMKACQCAQQVTA